MADYYPQELLDKRLENLASARDLTIRLAQFEVDLCQAHQARLRADSMGLIQIHRDRITGRQDYFDGIAPLFGETRRAKMEEELAARKTAEEARIAQIFTETEAAVEYYDPIISREMATIAKARSEYAEGEGKARLRHLNFQTEETKRLAREAAAAAEREQERLNRIQTMHNENLQWLQEARDDLAAKETALTAAQDAQANPSPSETRTPEELLAAVSAATSARDSAAQWVTKTLNNAVAFRAKHSDVQLSVVPGVPAEQPGG